MQLRLASFFAATILLLTACGSAGGSNALDATNADTLIASLNTISENMTEEERKTFGEDLLTIYSSTRRDIENIDAHPRDYSKAFNNHGLAKRIALEYKELVHGKSPRELASQAQALRKQSIITKLEREQNELTTQVAYVQRLQRCTDKLIAAGEARGETTVLQAFSQRPTDPLHMRNLVNRKEACILYRSGSSEVIDAFEETLSAARKHNYDERFNPPALTEIKQATQRLRSRYPHCGGAGQQIEQACNASRSR